MRAVTEGLYEVVRFAPTANYDRPFQILGSTYDGIETIVVSMTPSEAVDLMDSLTLLVYAFRDAQYDG